MGGGNQRINFLNRETLEKSLLAGDWVAGAEEPKVQDETDPLESALNAVRAAVTQAVAQKPTIDETAVLALIRREIDAAKLPRQISIAVNGAPAVTVTGAVHPAFDATIKAVSADVPVFFSGPTGSGKSHLARQVAEALSLPFYASPVCPQTTAAHLSGYMGVNGAYISTDFRRAYETGGVYLLDEVDAGSASVLLILNSATSNGYMGFPDGMVQRHKDFRLIAAANTWGMGATRQYVGRLPLDAAFLARFCRIEVGYDEALETSLVSSNDVLTTMRKIRKICTDNGLQVVASPRQAIIADRLVSAGMTFSEAIDAAVLTGIGADAAAKIREGM
jgi:cobaltochelatase CobS